jgi:hypothetical protein
MQQFYIRASIYAVAPEHLHRVLKTCAAGLSFRMRTVGCEMIHDSPDLRLSLETVDELRPAYALNAEYTGNPQAVELWVHTLCQRLNDAEILYLLDYVEEDAAGNEVGEEHHFQHPAFHERYQPR